MCDRSVSLLIFHQQGFRYLLCCFISGSSSDNQGTMQDPQVQSPYSGSISHLGWTDSISLSSLQRVGSDCSKGMILILCHCSKTKTRSSVWLQFWIGFLESWIRSMAIMIAINSRLKTGWSHLESREFHHQLNHRIKEFGQDASILEGQR